MNLAQINKVIEHFKWYYDHGYITSRDGNAAFYLSEAYTVTASGGVKNNLIENDFIVLDKQGKDPFLSDKKPSIETPAHIEAIQATGRWFSVHVHSPNTVALFGLFDPTDHWGTTIPNVLNTKWPELFRYTKVGTTVPFLEPGSKELHAALSMSFVDAPDIVVMQNHGVLAVGSNFEQCREHIVRLEHISGILLKILSASGGKTNLIL